MFDEFEFNPMSAAAGLVGGALTLYMMSTVEVGMIFKIGGVIASAIVGYLVFDNIMKR